MNELATPRLRLRRWRPTDRDPFAAMNADAQVMEHFPAALSCEESDALASAIEHHFVEHGFGLWAVEIPGVAPFAGFVGLSIPRFIAPFMPAVEVGWRLAVPYWGFGYATEGARAALTYGFESLGQDEVISVIHPENTPSIRVAERIGERFDRKQQIKGQERLIYSVARAPGRG